MLQKVVAIALLGGLVILAAMVGTELSLYANLRSLIIVLGGTVMATMIAYPWRQMLDAARTLKTSFGPPRTELNRLLTAMVELARVYRFLGPRELEFRARRLDDDLILFGSELVADGKGKAEVVEGLERECDLSLSALETQMSLFQTMGRLAPAFGLAGTLIGLIKMFGQIASPTELGVGMAVALLTTFYGIMISNLVLLPLSKKVREYARQEATRMTLIIEAMGAMADHEHPTAIDHRLRSRFAARRSSRERAAKAAGSVRTKVAKLAVVKKQPVTTGHSMGDKDRVASAG